MNFSNGILPAEQKENLVLNEKTKEAEARNAKTRNFSISGTRSPIIQQPLSLVFVERTEEAFEIQAGDIGLEAMVMRFAEDDS